MMKQYVKITNGNPEIYTIKQLYKDNPNVSFPAELTDKALKDLNIFELVVDEMPAVDKNVHHVVPGEYYVGGDAKWHRGWNLELKAEETVAAVVRNKRNAKLFDSDWTQLMDIPESVRIPWAQYRQALRDVPQQEGFPQNVVWPVLDQ